jgi:hypothetical protein
MAIITIPKLKPIPDGATRDDRERLHKDYVAELVRLNPGHLHADGTLKIVLKRIVNLFS